MSKTKTFRFNNINNLLKNLESILKINSNEMNDVKIIQSSAICELMLHLLLKRKQYNVKKKPPFSYLIDFSKKNKIIPEQCCSFLEIIKKYRNQSANNITTSKYFTSTFLNAFMNYISCFNLNYPSPNQFNINGCCSIIYSKYNFINDNRQFNSIYGSIHGKFEEKINTFECPNCRFTLYKGDNFCPNCGTRIESDTIETKITNKLNEFKDKYFNNDFNSKQEQTQNDYTPNLIKKKF